MKGCSQKYQAGMGLPHPSAEMGNGDNVFKVSENVDNNCIKPKAVAQTGLGKEASKWVAKSWF